MLKENIAEKEANGFNKNISCVNCAYASTLRATATEHVPSDVSTQSNELNEEAAENIKDVGWKTRTGKKVIKKNCDHHAIEDA